MKKYIVNNPEFMDYCKKNKISYKKIMKMPKCFTSDRMQFQVVDWEKAKLGLRDSTSAKVILNVERIAGNLVFEKSSDILDYAAEDDA